MIKRCQEWGRRVAPGVNKGENYLPIKAQVPVSPLLMQVSPEGLDALLGP